jgi:hypothetical protein
MNGTSSIACLMAGFGISNIEPLGSATTVLVSKMDLREIGCEDERWMDLTQDHCPLVGYWYQQC